MKSWLPIILQRHIHPSTRMITPSSTHTLSPCPYRTVLRWYVHTAVLILCCTPSPCPQMACGASGRKHGCVQARQHRRSLQLSNQQGLHLPALLESRWGGAEPDRCQQTRAIRPGYVHQRQLTCCCIHGRIAVSRASAPRCCRMLFRPQSFFVLQLHRT